MTLLVGGKIDGKIWMVADTTITGGSIQLRRRIYQIKIVASRDGRGLIGFAGDEHYGRKLVERAASLRAGTEVVEMLTAAHQEHRSVDFAYGYVNQAGPQLVRIADGSAEEVPTFYLGVADAFEHFQRIRHDPKIDPAPEAIHTFVCASRSSEPVPSPLSTAITSMLRLFVERAERDVGGWPVAYFLTAEGAFFCGYGYAVSDPILKKIGTGSVIPHGSAQAGGFGLSVTEYGDGEGVVVYWLQQPGGMVFRRSCEAYELHEFHGTPSQFKQSVREALGKEIDLLFGDNPPGPTRAIAVMRDEAGTPAIAIAKHNDSFSIVALNVATPFRAESLMNLKLTEANLPGGGLSTEKMSLNLSDDKAVATLELLQKGQPTTEIFLDAAELDQVLAKLSEARALMREPVPLRPLQEPGTREVVVLDPMWQTDPSFHGSLGGIILRLRHLGFGWLAFLLPHHEAFALGRWLCDYEGRRVQTAPANVPGAEDAGDGGANE